MRHTGTWAWALVWAVHVDVCALRSCVLGMWTHLRLTFLQTLHREHLPAELQLERVALGAHLPHGARSLGGPRER